MIDISGIHKLAAQMMRMAGAPLLAASGKTRNSFDVDFSTPVLACPCHFARVDPVRHGQVLKGPAPRPPLQLKVRFARAMCSSAGDLLRVTG